MRHFQAFLLFLCLTIAYAKRVNLTVGLVAMTDRMSANPDYEVSTKQKSYFKFNFFFLCLSQEYDWNQQTQSTILSSFFWGYVFTQVPAGQLAERFGPKMIIFFAMLISSILTMLTPICASMGGWQVNCDLLRSLDKLR